MERSDWSAKRKREKIEIAARASEAEILAYIVKRAAAPIPPVYSFCYSRLRLFKDEGLYIRPTSYVSIDFLLLKQWLQHLE